MALFELLRFLLLLEAFEIAEMHPRYEVQEGVEVVWQVPETPKAVLLLLHGSNSNAMVFWDPHPDCPKCTGLPENRAITLAALDRGYAVIAITSVSNWIQWPVEGNLDVANVIAILRRWRKQEQLTDLPLTALGISLGGKFLSVLAYELSFFSMIIMIADGNAAAIEAACSRGSYPPTLFVHMPRDEITESSLQLIKAKLAGIKVPVGSVECFPFPVRSDYFTERIPGVTMELSSSIVRGLEERGYLDSSAYLRNSSPSKAAVEGWYDPEDWEQVLDELQIFPVPNASWSARWYAGVVQELRVAFAFHSTTSLPVSEMLDWLDGRTWSKNREFSMASMRR